MATAEDELSIDLKSRYPEHVIKVGKIIFGEKKDKITEKMHKEIREKIKKECPEKSNKEVDKEISKFKKELKKKIDCQTVRLSRAVCALLNSGGGVIRAEIENEGFSFEKDALGLDIPSLDKCIHRSDFSEYFDIKVEESSVLIFVKSWCSEKSRYPRVCSVSTGLYKRSNSSAMIREPINALTFLKRKQAGVAQRSSTEGEPAPKQACLQADVPPSAETDMQKEEPLPEAAAQFFEQHELKYEESLNFAESTKIEFKAFPEDEDILGFVRSKLPCYVSAFASTEGGLIIFGVDDKKSILGHEQELNDWHLENEVHKTIMGLPHFHFCTSEDKVKYKCRTFPVCDSSKASHGCVVAVRIEPFCCVVFSDPPDSWAIKDSNLERIKASEWCQLMTAEDPDISKLADEFKCQLSISNKPPFCKPVYSQIGSCLEDLQNYLFPVNFNGISFKPEELCTKLFSKNRGLEDIMKMKMENLRVSKGLLIFSRSWAVDVGLQQHPCVACDILLVATERFPVLYTITKNKNYSNSSTIPVLEYSRNVARILKQKLVNEGGYTRKVCVIPQVIELGGNGEPEMDSNLDMYGPTYKVSEDYLKEFVQSLTIVLLRFKSALSDQLGYNFFNLLTIKQYEILNMDFQKEPKLFIYGLPGSGKTIIAKEVIKRIKNTFHCSSEEVLYICENRPLCDTVSQENICQAVTRNTFLDKVCREFHTRQDVRDQFGIEYTEVRYPVKHIIIDEAQNFQSEEGKDWYREATLMTTGRRVLWIFLDYLQTTHTFDCGLPPPDDQYPQEWLTVGVRNSTQIYKEMLQQMNRIVISHRRGLNIPYETLKKLLKDATCGHSLEGVLKKHPPTNRDEIVKNIVRNCVSYLRKGYSMENIAVLCNTKDERDLYKPLLEEQMSRERKLRLKVAFTTFDEAKGKGIVIDSVRRFSGLERYIIFGIFPNSVHWKFADNLLLCMVSRANLHCHLLFEK